MLRVRCGPGEARGQIVPVREGCVPDRHAAAAAADGFSGAPDTVCEVFAPPGRVVLVGLGEDAVAAGAIAASRLLREHRVQVDARGFSAREAAGLAAGACLRSWRFHGLKSRADEDAPRLEALDLLCDAPGTQAAWQQISAGIEGALFTRDLVAEPGNTLTPAGFVRRLDRLAAAGVAIEVLDAAALAQAGFGGLLAVGRGSAHPPCLAVLRWQGRGGPPVALVGKGVTFDTGGVSIKPAEDMWDMRADMAGAASCAGAMLALARRGSPASVMAILPLAENATGAASYRPGDILRMFSGTTVQVVDTDAEGRLLLADALAYAVAQGARAIVDLATLTGSIVSALGHEQAGLFDNDADLATAVVAAGMAVGERVWRMPIGEAHRRALDSDIADLKHCVDGTGHPDACQAAAFLKEFVGETPWVHLDIAGVESRQVAQDRFAQGPTGFGVRLLDRLIADRFEAGAG